MKSIRRDADDRQRLFNVSGAYRGRTWAAAAVVLSGIAIAGLAPRGDARAWVVSLALSAALGLSLGVMRSSRMRAERALADEQRWLETLPFSLQGWWALLGEDYSRMAARRDTNAVAYSRVRVILEFEASSPDAKELHERLLGARLLELTALDSTHDSAVLTLALAQHRMPDQLCPVIHRLVDDALRPLHAAHPLSRVALSAAK